MTRATQRLRKEAWLDNGLDLLSQRGFPSVTIDAICSRVGRSKGSFYHHFDGIDAFIAELLQHWERRSTNTIVEQVEAISDPSDRRQELRRLAASLDHDAERAVRVWAGSDARPKAVLEKVDARRVGFLARVIQDATGNSPEHSLDLAKLEYAALVGMKQLFPDLNGTEFEALFRKMTHLITPDLKLG